jgi:hypothetical protein
MVGHLRSHRLGGEAGVSNVRELPLAAALLEAPGCVPAHRHARFAPLHVPRRILERGRGLDGATARRAHPQPSIGIGWASRPALAAFRRIVAFVNSREVQEVWAPAFGRTRILPVPLVDDATQDEEGVDSGVAPREAVSLTRRLREALLAGAGPRE